MLFSTTEEARLNKYNSLISLIFISYFTCAINHITFENESKISCYVLFLTRHKHFDKVFFSTFSSSYSDKQSLWP
jgi:hypothetical protein